MMRESGTAIGPSTATGSACIGGLLGAMGREGAAGFPTGSRLGGLSGYFELDRQARKSARGRERLFYK
jgi:hypothetical protein